MPPHTETTLLSRTARTNIIGGIILGALLWICGFLYLVNNSLIKIADKMEVHTEQISELKNDAKAMKKDAGDNYTKMTSIGEKLDFVTSLILDGKLKITSK